MKFKQNILKLGTKEENQQLSAPAYTGKCSEYVQNTKENGILKKVHDLC